MSTTVIDLDAIAQPAADLAVAKEREQHKRELEELLARLTERLQPLGEILNISRKAAAARIARNPSLRALGIPSGKRLLFRPSEVFAHLRMRGAR
jgi:hypothetical protein